jgi:hypothetical protein
MAKTDETGKKRQRSPNYPAVNLEDAIGRLKRLYDADGRPGAPMATAVKHFGFSGPHGQAMTIVSALKKFGLIEDKAGRIVPSPLGLDIMEFKPGQERYEVAIRDAACKPDIYSELVETYREHGRLPSDEALRPELITDKGFNPKAVDGFLVDFRKSMEFAGLLEENELKLPPAQGEDNEAKTQIRRAPEEKGPAWTRDVLSPPPSQQRRPPMQTGTKEATLPLDTGAVFITWPEHISPDEIEDVESWLEVILRKIKRSADHKRMSAKDQATEHRIEDHKEAEEQ